MQYLLTSWFIATIWRNAHKKIPTYLKPENCGWLIADGKYMFKWFDGLQLSSTVKDMIGEEIIGGKILFTHIIKFTITIYNQTRRFKLGYTKGSFYNKNQPCSDNKFFYVVSSPSITCFLI